jgi:hypothetical protein
LKRGGIQAARPRLIPELRGRPSAQPRGRGWFGFKSFRNSNRNCAPVESYCPSHKNPIICTRTYSARIRPCERPWAAQREKETLQVSLLFMMTKKKTRAQVKLQYWLWVTVGNHKICTRIQGMLKRRRRS